MTELFMTKLNRINNPFYIGKLRSETGSNQKQLGKVGRSMPSGIHHRHTTLYDAFRRAELILLLKTLLLTELRMNIILLLA